MNRLTTHLAIGVVSAIVAAGTALALSSSDNVRVQDQDAASSDQAIDDSESRDANLETIERRIGDMETSISKSQANDRSLAAAALVRDLEDRVNALEIEPREEPPAESEPEEENLDQQDHERLPLEEVKQRTLDAWYGRLDAHDQEERDPEWSFETSTAFEQDLTALSDQGDLQYLNTDCRSATCTATVGFENYDQALSGYQALLHHEYSVNCTREVLLPEPDDVQAPYVATVLYDCTASRP